LGISWENSNSNHSGGLCAYAHHMHTGRSF
jgi:hypothetical protein